MDIIEQQQHDDVNKALTGAEGDVCLLLIPPPTPTFLPSMSIKSNEIAKSMQDLAEESSKTDDDLDNNKADKSNENLLNGKLINDGSDSGVEAGASSIISVTTVNGIIFQRALSSNSGGYASSTGGLDENVGPVSCNSSMISCCSDTCEKLSNTLVVDGCASEGGSESSSVAGGPTSRSLKKKVSLKDSPRRSNESNCSQKSSSSRVSVTRSNTLPTKSVAPNLLTRDRAARSRDKPKPEASSSGQGDIMTTSLTRSTSLKRPPKPDSFPMSLSMTSPRVNLSRTPSLSRNRTPLATPVDDGRWPSTANKSNSRNVTPRSAVAVGGNVNIAVASATATTATTAATTPDALVIKTRIGNIHLESKSSALDKYGTLPRRRKERKSMEDLNFKLTPDSRSSSTTRNELRLSSLTLASGRKETSIKPLINYPKIAKKPNVKKTKIFHETSIQTAITGEDLAKVMNGDAVDLPRIDAVEMCAKSTQSDLRDKELEKLRGQLERMSADHSQLLSKLSDKTHAMASLEHELLREREEKLTVQKELQNNTERVMCMLESFPFGPAAVVTTPTNCDSDTPNQDSFLLLESQLTMSGSVLEKQQDEIVKLQGICRALQRDMEKSLRIQDDLIKQKNELEEESNELQDFLQAEKVAFMDALKEAENENQQHKAKIAQRDGELERMKEECRSLVRAGEQKRQENLGLQARYNAIEHRSKDVLITQSGALSGANVALASLSGRLEHLVEQLILTYNISERDLEDIVFFNDAYSNSSSSSGQGTPDFETASGSDSVCSLKSPQRGQSFLAAVINAIKSAASSVKPNAVANAPDDKKSASGVADAGDDDKSEMLDSETEPCLMMDNVLEDSQMPDSHSHNLISSSQQMISQIEVPSEILRSSLECDTTAADGDDGSLENLSQAIVNRQQIELQTSAMALRNHSERNSTSDDISGGHDSVAEMPSIGDFCTAQALVDQVIEVDNMVTKLLKVLRLVQLDNENCIQELVMEKNKIQVCRDDAANDWEMINQKLKIELKDSAEQLIEKCNELSGCKIELQKHRQEIDRLNEDICNLSTLCSGNSIADKSKNDNASIENKSFDKSEIVDAFERWKQTGNPPENEIVSHIVSAYNELPSLREKLREKECQLETLACKSSSSDLNVMTNSWQQAIAEAKRQYDAIDGALETLSSLQSIVKDCPALAKVQRDLEESNFNTINTLPIASVLLTNGNHIAAAAVPSASHHSDMNANETINGTTGENGNTTQIIDSTA